MRARPGFTCVFIYIATVTLEALDKSKLPKGALLNMITTNSLKSIQITHLIKFKTPCISIPVTHNACITR